MNRTLLCVARGHNQQWEAFCLDFDLAVQGRTFEEVEALLKEAIRSYLDTAMNEAEPSRSQLLARAVPFRTSLMWSFRIALGAFLSRKRNDGSTYGFPVSCRA